MASESLVPERASAERSMGSATASESVASDRASGMTSGCMRSGRASVIVMAVCLLTVVCEALPLAVVIDRVAGTNKIYQAEDCEAISAPPTSKYWDAVGRCGDCVSIPGCGFCRSTMTCVYGAHGGPVSRMSCPDWLFYPEECPMNPHCNSWTECDTCARVPQCVWCSSDATCMSVEESYGSTCTSLVTETPCPVVVTPRTLPGAPRTKTSHAFANFRACDVFVLLLQSR